MVPFVYQMVDLEGLDLSRANGDVVPGIYNKITQALASDKVEIFYNWYFAGLIIPPSYVLIDDSTSGRYVINEAIVVQSDDRVSIVGNIPVLSPLSVNENGTYTAGEGVTGFTPVTVNVQPVLEQLTALANGSYTPPEGIYGFSSVVVNVPKVIQSLSVTQNGTYNAGEGVDGYSPVIVNVPAPQPVTEELTVNVNGVYTPGTGVDGFSKVSVNVPDYSGGYHYISPTHKGAGALYLNSSGDLWHDTVLTNYDNFYDLDPGYYLIMLDNTVDNRFRIGFFNGISYSDVASYFETAGSSTVRIAANDFNANYNSNLIARQFLTVSESGLLFIGCSNRSVPVNSIVFKIIS